MGAQVAALVDLLDGSNAGTLADKLAGLKAERQTILARRNELVAALTDEDADPEMDVRATLDLGPAVVKLQLPETQARMVRSLLGTNGWVELEKHGQRGGA